MLLTVCCLLHWPIPLYFLHFFILHTSSLFPYIFTSYMNYRLFFFYSLLFVPASCSVCLSVCASVFLHRFISISVLLLFLIQLFFPLFPPTFMSYHLSIPVPSCPSLPCPPCLSQVCGNSVNSWLTVPGITGVGGLDTPGRWCKIHKDSHCTLFIVSPLVLLALYIHLHTLTWYTLIPVCHIPLFTFV